MGCRRRHFAGPPLACALALCLTAHGARAAGSQAPADEAGATGPDPSGAGDAAQQAQAHFRSAKDLYERGNYREAVKELEAARALDPSAKELVFNLGIVHEKMAEFDAALAAFRDYVAMEGVTVAERDKAESILTRIEGAKREAAARKERAQGDGSASRPATPAPQPAVAYGRLDAATLGAAGVAVVGFGVGTFFGVRALGSRPDDFTTGSGGSYEDLRNATDRAHTDAVIADIGLAVGLVATVAAAYLYFARTTDPAGTTASTARTVARRLPPHGLGFVFP